MEATVTYNSADKKYYLYVGEAFLEWYKDLEIAMKNFKKVKNYIEEGYDFHEIRDIFGWEAVN